MECRSCSRQPWSVLRGFSPSASGPTTRWRQRPDDRYFLAMPFAVYLAVLGWMFVHWLKAAAPNARAMCVSSKDRGAILPIGQSKEQVYWYQSGLFTTSRYYADTLPSWVQAFNARRLPFKTANTVWSLLLPDSA